jgi:hypothetical protein
MLESQRGPRQRSCRRQRPGSCQCRPGSGQHRPAASFERTRSRRRPASASRTAATVCTDSSGATTWALQEGTDSRVAASRGSLGSTRAPARCPRRRLLWSVHSGLAWPYGRSRRRHGDGDGRLQAKPSTRPSFPNGPNHRESSKQTNKQTKKKSNRTHNGDITVYGRATSAGEGPIKPPLISDPSTIAKGNLGSPPTHLHGDWAHPCRICTGTGCDAAARARQGGSTAWRMHSAT